MKAQQRNLRETSSQKLNPFPTLTFYLSTSVRSTCQGKKPRRERHRTQEAEDPTTSTKEEGSARTTVKANLKFVTVPQAQVQTILMAAGRE